MRGRSAFLLHHDGIELHLLGGGHPLVLKGYCDLVPGLVILLFAAAASKAVASLCFEGKVRLAYFRVKVVQMLTRVDILGLDIGRGNGRAHVAELDGVVPWAEELKRSRLRIR